ncbi:MAG: ABC transporter ATP-binding protein [Candidatus Bathyarchaeia archaeon]
MAKVVLKNLTKKFRNKLAVDNLSLEVGDGEFVCLLGEPGAGKTTTLMMIAGLENPDYGEIYIDDALINDLEPRERDVAMTFQSYALYPHLTVYENLAFPLIRRKFPKDEADKRVREVAGLLRITHILDKKPGLCSGGERQRVALGRTLVRQPKLYLFDEPLTNLDAKLRLHMRTELKKIQKEIKQTAIFTTPDYEEALTIADKIAIIKEGKLLQYDNSENIFNRPKDLYVATFVGSPPMNIFNCIVEKTDNKIYLNSEAFKIDITDDTDLIESTKGSSEFLLGVRPSDIIVRKVRDKKDDIEASLFVKEPMGVDLVLDLEVDTLLIKAKVDQTMKVDVGEKVWINIPKNKIHLFDKQTEKSIYN